MKKFGKKLLIVFVAFVFASPLFAASAKVTFVKGKAEVLKNNAWMTLNIGDTLEMSDTISTGFQSEIKIEYGGSVMSLGALTRITLENLSSTSSKEDVSIYLKTGAIRSKVTHTEEKRVSYKVKSPVAVCSVRGTGFDMKACGQVDVWEGSTVVYANDNSNNNVNTSTSEDESEAEEEAISEENVSEESSAPEVIANNENEESDNSDGKPGDYPSGNAFTPANEISQDAPLGSVVVTKNQSVTVAVNRTTETPFITATLKKEAIKDTVSTISEKEAVTVGGNSSIVPVNKTDIKISAETAKTIEELQEKVKGSIKATVRFED